MGKNAKFIKSEAVQAWLGQFDPSDQNLLQQLLESMLLVSRDAFNERLRTLILTVQTQANNGPVGLYAEREVRIHKKVPQRLFKEKTGKVKRSYGITSISPVQPIRAYQPDVGSEGIIAQLISELCREFPKVFLNHPGPDILRDKKVRHCFIVTDFIGSGNRVTAYIKTAWRLRTVRSWWSAKQKCGTRFDVIAYSATRVGKEKVTRHKSNPAVHIVMPCPTIDDSFNDKNRKLIKQLCTKYNPSRNPYEAWGYDKIGALIAFAHGAPNNMPLFFIRKSPTRLPLFPSRVTSATRTVFNEDRDLHLIQARLIEMRRERLANSSILQNGQSYTQEIFLFLAALSRPPRSDEALSGKTGFTIVEIQKWAAKAEKLNFIDAERRLTDRGHAELAQASKTKMPAQTTFQVRETIYYPKSLRAPQGSS